MVVPFPVTMSDSGVDAGCLVSSYLPVGFILDTSFLSGSTSTLQEDWIGSILRTYTHQVYRFSLSVHSHYLCTGRVQPFEELGIFLKAPSGNTGTSMAPILKLFNSVSLLLPRNPYTNTISAPYQHISISAFQGFLFPQDRSSVVARTEKMESSKRNLKGRADSSCACLWILNTADFTVSVRRLLK